MVDINSESELRHLCKRIKVSRDSINSFKPPDKNQSDLEVDLAYSVKQVKISNVETDVNKPNDTRRGRSRERSLSRGRERDTSQHRIHLRKDRLNRLLQNRNAGRHNTNKATSNSSYHSFSRNNYRQTTNCLRCNKPGHIARFCTNRILRCFTSGKPGYIKLTCPRCNNSENFSKSQ